MINVEYQINPQEMANASMGFLINRPMMSALFSIMKGCCLILIVGFAFAAKANILRPQDYAALTFAVIWLFFNKPIHKKIIKFAMSKTKFSKQTLQYSFNDKEISGTSWKKLKFVLKNKDGYIIPMTGIKNSGKFIWLPRKEIGTENEQELLDILKKNKLKLKAI